MAVETYPEDARRLFDLIKDIKFAMLTTVDEDGSLRSRPMANSQADAFEGELWFFTRASSHKVDETQKTQQVNLSFANPSSQDYVSISGPCELVRDKEKARQLWSPMLKIWFPQGLEDPDLGLLKITVEKAEYWDSPSTKMTRLYGMAKALLGGDKEALGENKKLNFV
jgi:general stress protein 26